ncbi:MAG: RNA methyltransferase [Bacteroidales bacterium]|nr:RNA methyltransferase [Bacteroidales bacterium]
MLSKSQIKLIRSLEHKKYRNETGLFIAEGTKVVLEFLKNNWYPYAIICSEAWAKEHSNVINPIICDNAIIDKISFLKTPPEVVGVFYQKKDTAFTKSIDDSLILALDEIQDAGNVGTILRIALWFGIDAVILGKGCADIYNPKVIQASMGAVSRLNFLQIDLIEFLKAQQHRTTIYGTFLEGENIHQAKLTPKGIIVLGNEGKGIAAEIETYVQRKIFIPHFTPEKPIDSINVAMAAAIICYEFRRNH